MHEWRGSVMTQLKARRDRQTGGHSGGAEEATEPGTSEMATTMSAVELPEAARLSWASDLRSRLWMSSIVFLQLMKRSKFSFTSAFSWPVRSLTSFFRFCRPFSSCAKVVDCTITMSQGPTLHDSMKCTAPLRRHSLH